MRSIKSQGFALIELLCSLLIMAIFFAIALPMVQVLFRQYQLKAAVEEVAHQLNMTRFFSVQLAKATYFSISPEQQRVEIYDLSAAGLKQVIKTFVLPVTGYQMIWRGFPEQDNFIRFNSLGMPQENGTIYFCAEEQRSLKGYKIILSQSGRVRIEKQDQIALCATFR